MKALAEPLADLLSRLNGDDSSVVAESVRALCVALSEGHVCVPCDHLAPGTVAALRSSRVTGGPGEFRPLILDGGNLYLARYQQYEERLARKLGERARAANTPATTLTRHRLARLTEDASQQRAVLSAIERQLCIITGGPGTGKTRTATVVLALLAEQSSQTGNPRVALAAPTGKAAARLSSSLAETLAKLDLQPAAKGALSIPAVTLHRLLGAIPGESQFRFNANRPLPLDLLVVDEASMIDLPMMAKLLDALRPETRLLLLGDRDQLASVEAGHVLGDICAARSESLQACVNELTTNHRFARNSGIHQLASRVKAGDLSNSIRLLHTETLDLSARKLPDRMADALKRPLIEGWSGMANAKTPAEALQRLGDFRILCAVHAGPQGVSQLNRIAEHVLAEAGLIKPSGPCYAGRPIMILRNDYQLKLFNGDLGILKKDEKGELRAYFPGEENQTRSFAPARLPEHETAFAMTVHKAQGSEFRKVLVVLPLADHPVLSRELVYTAITRARVHVELWWTEASLASALRRGVIRWSGLRQRFQN